MATLYGSPERGSALEVKVDSVTGLPKPKRHKVGIACERCRSRKSKCDGVRPRCGPCSKRKNGAATCIYSEGVLHYEHPPYQDRTVQSSYDAESDGHGHIQNALWNAQNGAQHTQSISSKETQSPTTIDTRKSISMPTAPAPPTPATTTRSDTLKPDIFTLRRHSPSPAGSDAAGDIDAMGNVDNWGLKAGILGASSSASFMQSICKQIDGTVTPDPDRLVRRTLLNHSSRTTLYRKRNQSITLPSAEYLLPPRKTADRLLEIHWNFSQVIFPWLDRLRMIDWYEGLWTGRENSDPFVDEQIYHCILNIVFAISYKLDQLVDPREQENLSNVHFERAQKLLSFNMLDTNHIGLIQALLLMGQYLQSTNMPRKCSRCIGLAIYFAQDTMGLHRPETTASIHGQHELEMARRAWHGCVLMDRVISMTFGRPTRISQEVATKIPMPMPIDDEFLDREGTQGTQPIGKPSKVGFFVAYCELHIVLGDILSTFYTMRTTSGLSSPSEYLHRNNTTGKQNVDKLLQFDNALAAWRANLEPHLQIETELQQGEEALIFRRQAVGLYARFLYVRMLLYRPFFSKSSETTDHPEASGIQDLHLAEVITSHGLVTCVKGAQQLLDHISTHIKSDHSPELLPPWWHVISYVYTAETIVIAAHMFPSVVERITSSDLTTSIRQGFSILQHYDGRKSAQRCRTALGMLYDKIMTHRAEKQSVNGSLITTDFSATDETLQNDLLGGYIYDTSPLNLFENNELLWLNSAPFDPDNNFWLPT